MSEVREKVQEELIRARKLHRNRQQDTLRCGLQVVEKDLFVDEQEILKLCNRIKRRKHADESDLFRLSNGFLYSTTNIAIFLKVQGAVNVLVKELTGSSGDKQLLAAEAFCNLSLGDSGSCLKVSKLISSYLLTMTTSVNNELAQTSLWTLYNLIAESEKAQEVFLAGKVDSKLLGILEGNYEAELQMEATKCLAVLVASPLFVDRNETNLLKILHIALKSTNNETPRLIYEILHKMNFIVEDDEITERITGSLIQQLAEKDPPLPIAQQLYSIRILGNISSCPKLSKGIIETIQKDPESFLAISNSLLQSEEEAVYSETIGLLGNIFKAFQDSGLEEEFSERIVNRLVVPRKPKYEFQQYVHQQEEQIQVQTMEN